MMHAMLAQFLKFAAGGAVGTACHYATLVIWVEVLGGDVVAGHVRRLLRRRAGQLPDRTPLRFRTAHVRTRARCRASRWWRPTAPRSTPASSHALHGAGVHYLAAQVVATGAVLAWNFLVNRAWTFTE